MSVGGYGKGTRRDLLSTIVANHHEYGGVLRGDIRHGNAEYGPAGIVERQQIGTGVARFERHHRLRLRDDVVKNGEAVDRAIGGQLRRTDLYRRGLRASG